MSVADHFVWPHALPLVLLAPLAWMLFHLLDRARARRLAALAGPRVAALAPELHPKRRRVRRVLFSAGLLFAVLAALQPAWGESADAMDERGADILVCLDVSRSMLAHDVAPSRLVRAQREIRALAASVRGDRLGLIVFAGEARLLVPLTRDTASLADMAETADPLSVGKGGTDLGAALTTALGAADAASRAHTAILLVTDGEDLGGRGLRVAEQCRQLGIPVHCVGFGSPLGSKIAVAGARGDEFVRDRAGGDVVSSMDAASLTKIGQATGGSFLEAASTEHPLVEVYEKHIRPAAARRGDGRGPQRHDNHFQWPLAAAFLLWILDLWLTDRRHR